MRRTAVVLRLHPLYATSVTKTLDPRSSSPMLSSLTKEQVRPLIEVNDQVNRLTSLEPEINGTRIVAVGDQSHGKSSVKEALSGVNLPRGEDIKTRVHHSSCSSGTTRVQMSTPSSPGGVWILSESSPRTSQPRSTSIHSGDRWPRQGRQG